MGLVGRRRHRVAAEDVGRARRLHPANRGATAKARQVRRTVATHTTDAQRVAATRLVLRVIGPPDLAAQVKDLTDRESSCRSFFTFTLATDGPADDIGRVRLEVEVPAAQIEVLDALAERADTSRQ